MNNTEFKQLIEEKKRYVIERHAYYKELEENGRLHSNDKDFSTFVAYSKADFDIEAADDLDDLLLGLAQFKKQLRNVKKLYGFRTSLEIYAHEDWIERCHVNAIWYYVRELTDGWIEKTATKMAKDVLSEIIKPEDYTLKTREIDCQLIPMFISGAITLDGLRELTYSVNLCDY